MEKKDLVKELSEVIKSNKLSAKVDNSNEFFVHIQATKEEILDLLKALKTSSKLRFALLADLFAADFPERENRFEIVYHLLSLKLNARVMIKVNVGDDESLPSATKVFSSACWYEREIFDLFGVVFDGNPDLRRILTDYGFQGHPLRKDFPVTGYVEVRYDEKEQKVIYEPVKLDQEFRKFDFESPWEGANYVMQSQKKKA